jgi:pyruvate dehydrogenase E2 component (dihydrolipoamide acetyltransferase)/2-oxoglutarate dehydrogenase E2 component (dihydrolipoamide succinyltransferase)
LPARPAPQPAAPGRILASPKARRLAAEQGLDLRRLAAAGHPQPYHVADLARLAALAPATATAVNRLSASAPPENLAAFRDLLKVQSGGLHDATLWSAFAAGALRPNRQDAPITIRAETLPGAPAATYGDPDLSPLADVAPTEGEAIPDLILRDLTASPLGELALTSDAAPVLCIAAGYRLTLTWPEGSLSTEAALALIIGVARRIEQPLRHLL